MTRFVSVTVLVMVVLAGAGIASAQTTPPTTGTLPDGSTLTFSELKIHENNKVDADFPAVDPNSKWLYFNLAHCQCGVPGIAKSDYHEDTFQYLLTVVGATMSVPHPIDIFVGPTCSDNVLRPTTCSMVGSESTVDAVKSSNGARVDLPVFKLMAPTPKTATDPPAGVADCKANAASVGTVWLLVDSSGDGQYDYSASQQIPIDTLPPVMPTDLTARGGEGAIQVSWTPPPDTTDTYAYQALCSKASDNTPAKPAGAPSKALYATAATLCMATASETAITLDPVTVVPDPADADAGVGAPDAGSGGLQTLDPAFLCAEEVSATATGLRIGGLKNGVAYNVVVLAIDKFGNAVGRYFTSPITPIPSTDFWEDLHDRNSKVEGGLCLLAETYGDDSSLTGALRAFRDDTLSHSRAGRWLSDAYYGTLGTLGHLVHGSIAARLVAGVALAPLVALALAWHWLSLPGLLAMLAVLWLWRRRGFAMPRRLLERAAPPAMVLALVLGTGSAHAGGYQPYWEDSNIQDDQNQAAPGDPSLVEWLVGVRVGPYTPDIDKHFAATPGPYQQMFTGTHVLAMLDVDRVLWSRFGQVAIGLSAGYMRNSASSFTMASSPQDANRARAGDDNSFTLIPTALTATYRFTMLDDDYGIPVVPYVRAGLSYYLWWISDADGLATVCKDGSDKETNPTCAKDKALGGSLGVQGSIGLAIRAERIDSSAAISMRQSGIQHAGLYGELSIAKVDGFGSETKLSVGDATWFAGVDFEF